MALNRDVFIRDGNMQMPFEIKYPAVAAANNFKPAAVTADATESATDSRWDSDTAGNYYYAVAGISKDGQSQVLKSSQVTVAAGKKVVLSITASSAGTETGYVIYRTNKGGANDTSNFREMARIAKDSSGTTIYTDINRDIPGTCKAYLLNMLEADDAIAWRQLMPMIRFPLATVNQATINWAQIMFGYLRITKRQQHVVIKNILPSAASWKPFE